MEGWIKLYRKLGDSEIMKKPPMYLKVFIWLLLHAQHKDYNGLKRGQFKTSIPEIMEAMAYKVGYRIEKPTKKEIFGIIEWLRFPHEGNDEGSMIVTTKVTHGFVYNIVKYDTYQTLDNCEGNDEGSTKVLRRSRQGNNINKNDKNDKNDKKLKPIVDFSTQINSYTTNTNIIQAIFDFLQHRKEIKKPIQSETTLKVFLKELDKHSDKASVLNQSIANGWQGIFPLKDQPKNQQNGNVFDEIGKERGYWK